jgi:hypothetical protein
LGKSFADGRPLFRYFGGTDAAKLSPDCPHK